MTGSGLALEVRELTGQDELYLLETILPPVAAMAGLADRVATLPGGAALDWAVIPAAQLAAVAMLLRQAWTGDRIVSEGICPRAGCGQRFDISFSVTAYLAAHRSLMPRNVTPAGDGWYELSGSDVRFRVPSVQDLLAALCQPGAIDALAARCFAPQGVTARQMRRVDKAMSAIAPSLVGLVGGACPSCGCEVSLTFDPLAYTLAELRDGFAGLYRETHLLAAAYKWPEESIHRLTRNRRRRYAALVSEAAVT
jgi:hypothetical protein